jgi:hypothetical protein
MLDGVELEKMNMVEMCHHLKKSCCPALDEIIKDAEKSLR